MPCLPVAPSLLNAVGTLVEVEKIELEIVKMCGFGPVLSFSDPYPTTANLLLVIGTLFSFSDLSIRVGNSFNMIGRFSLDIFGEKQKILINYHVVLTAFNVYLKILSIHAIAARMFLFYNKNDISRVLFCNRGRTLIDSD